MFTTLRRSCLAVAVWSLSFTATPATAQVTDVYLVPVDNSSVPELAGFNTYDLFIDFVGDYTGSQMLFELSKGAFYQEDVGNDAPPSATFIGFVPTLEFDTFFAQGGATEGETIGSLSIGAGGGTTKFWPLIRDDIKDLASTIINEQILNIQWGPSGSDFIADKMGLLVARITISQDANGILQYIASANQQISPDFRFDLIDGVFPDAIPEPATAGLLFAAAGLATLRRRSHH